MGPQFVVVYKKILINLPAVLINIWAPKHNRCRKAYQRNAIAIGCGLVQERCEKRRQTASGRYCLIISKIRGCPLKCPQQGKKYFGLVLNIMEYKSRKNSLHMVHDSRFRLSSAIYTQSLNRTFKAIKKLDTDVKYLNTSIMYFLKAIHMPSYECNGQC